MSDHKPVPAEDSTICPGCGQIEDHDYACPVALGNTRRLEIIYTGVKISWDKKVKYYSDDKDRLPPDITDYAEFPEMEFRRAFGGEVSLCNPIIWGKVNEAEADGWHIVWDIAGEEYETGDRFTCPIVV